MPTHAPHARDEYVLGHTDRELERLERQAGFFSDMTRDVLVRAGLAPGMRVLDVGCGVGDVSLIAARLVGEAGQVTGLDISAEALGVAARRVEAAGLGNIDFRHGPIADLDRLDGFDAVIGRFILVHIPDAAGMLRQVAERVRPGTVIAFCEMDAGTVSTSPSMPLFDENLERIGEVYRRTGLDPNPGTRLFSIFRAAGLSPDLFGFTRIGDRRDTDGLAFLTESVRSLMPAMARLGIVEPEAIGIDTLQQRLEAAAHEADPVIFYPRFIGAWARS